METRITPVQAELIRAACAIATKKEFDHLLYIGDLPLPEDLVKAKSMARKKLVQAVASQAQLQVIEAMGIATISLPIYEMTRPEKFKIALVGGIAKGLFKEGEVVLGLIGRRATSYPDSMLTVTIGLDNDGDMDTGFGVIHDDKIPSSVFESLIDLAVGIAVDGWEGRPLGTLLVVGDTPAVMEKSKQLTLNPFQGYSEEEKNVLNPDVRNAIRNFAVLDGAFVIREDGVVLAAGRYLRFNDESEFDVPLGLGARHVAAAGISQDTEAIAIVVSQTTGEVRVFQHGSCLLHIHPQQRLRREFVVRDEEARRQEESGEFSVQGDLLSLTTPEPRDVKEPRDPVKRAEGKERREVKKEVRKEVKKEVRKEVKKEVRKDAKKDVKEKK